MKSNITKQRGAALLSALILMAVAASIATWCYVQQRLWLRQAQALLQAERAAAVLEDARAWALQVVAKPITTRRPLTYQQRMEGFEVEASIVSEEGRFNLNTLQESNNMLHFVFLLQALDAKLSTDRAIRMAYDLNTWMSPSSRLERYYLGLQPPYRQAHRALVQWSELRALRGMSADLYRRLARGAERYITALPLQDVVVDVNVVSAPVLASVTSLTNEEAQRVVRCRDQSPWFQTPADFITRCARGLHLEHDVLKATSNYYVLQARARHGDAQQSLTCLLERVDSPRGPVAKIVWQEWNDV